MAWRTVFTSSLFFVLHLFFFVACHHLVCFCFVFFFKKKTLLFFVFSLASLCSLSFLLCVFVEHWHETTKIIGFFYMRRRASPPVVY